MSALLGFFMILGGIVSPGISSAVSLDDTKKQVDQLQNQYDDLENQWNNVFKQQSQIKQEIIDDITNKLDSINQTIAQTNQSHKQFQQQNQQIQFIGVTLIVFIFFLLLLKQYDLYDSINDFILSPFKIFSKK